MNIHIRLLLILVLITGLSILSLAQHSINGRVLNEQGEVLTNATVVLLHPTDSTLQYFDVVDEKGIYESN